MPAFHGMEFSVEDLARIRERFSPERYDRERWLAKGDADVDNYDLNRMSGTAARAVLREKSAARAAALKEKGVAPTLAVVLVGGDEASRTYAQSTVAEAARCGVEARLVSLPEEKGQKALLAKLRSLARDRAVHGILLMGPLPKGPAADPYDEAAAKHLVSPEKDLDALSFENAARFYLKGETPLFYPPTIGGALLCLDLFGVDIRGKRVAVVGRGNLVGRPMGIALMDMLDCTVTYCHTKTHGLRAILLASEAIVCACGRPHLLGAEDVPEGAILLDMGVHIKDGKTVGEFTPEAYNRAYAALKTPGGSGAMTVHYLLHNCLLAAERSAAKIY